MKIPLDDLGGKWITPGKPRKSRLPADPNPELHIVIVHLPTLLAGAAAQPHTFCRRSCKPHSSLLIHVPTSRFTSVKITVSPSSAPITKRSSTGYFASPASPYKTLPFPFTPTLLHIAAWMPAFPRHQHPYLHSLHTKCSKYIIHIFNSNKGERKILYYLGHWDVYSGRMKRILCWPILFSSHSTRYLVVINTRYAQNHFWSLKKKKKAWRKFLYKKKKKNFLFYFMFLYFQIINPPPSGVSVVNRSVMQVTLRGPRKYSERLRRVKLASRETDVYEEGTKGLSWYTSIALLIHKLHSWHNHHLSPQTFLVEGSECIHVNKKQAKQVHSIYGRLSMDHILHLGFQDFPFFGVSSCYRKA